MPSSSSQTRSSARYKPMDDLNLEDLPDDEVEALLFEDEPEETSGLWNLPTLAGLSIIAVGVIYLLEQTGVELLSGFDLTFLVETMPILAGVLIILVGFGVLSWRPSSKEKRQRVAVPSSASEHEDDASRPEEAETSTKRLTRSRHDRKIAGVCGGIASYLNLEDATLVRIAFIIGALSTGFWPFFLAYVALVYAMPSDDESAGQERITIICDR